MGMTYLNSVDKNRLNKTLSIKQANSKSKIWSQVKVKNIFLFIIIYLIYKIYRWNILILPAHSRIQEVGWVIDVCNLWSRWKWVSFKFNPWDSAGMLRSSHIVLLRISVFI